MSDTPRTDAILRNAPFHHYRVEDVLDLCRQMERELAAMTKNRDECAAVFMVDRAHELFPNNPDCACPSCNIHRRYQQAAKVTEQTMRDILFKPYS